MKFNERQNLKYFPSLREYSSRFGVTKKVLDEIKNKVILMHPGPINRGVEISSDVADSKQSIILDQVENGVAIRMAVLYLLAKDKNENSKTQLIKITSNSVKENTLAVDRSNSNYIFDISTLDKKSQNAIKEKLITFGKLLIKNNLAFVIVSNYLNMIDFNIVPTLEEAYDIIELEEIERDLLKN